MSSFCPPLEDILRLQPQRYAVVDGGSVFDLLEEVERRKLTAWPLYLEYDKATAAAGPFLIPVPDLHTVEDVIDIADEQPAITFWSWPGSSDSLLRHLRSIIMLAVTRSTGDQYLLVRLGDPRTLAMVIPALTPPQIATFLGSNGATLLYAENGNPIFVCATNLEKTAERIRISDEQYDDIANRYGVLLKNLAVARMMARLAEPPDQARAHILDAFERAERYGMSEPEHILRFIAFDVAMEARFELTQDFYEAIQVLRDETMQAGIKLFHVERTIREICARRGLKCPPPPV